VTVRLARLCVGATSFTGFCTYNDRVFNDARPMKFAMIATVLLAAACAKQPEPTAPVKFTPPAEPVFVSNMK
jgi:hypothetical protein